ncbi:MAG: DUF1552 domain-containing protein [Polyangiales bacterium]
MTRNNLRRRQFLRGAGATLALPTLVSLLPKHARAQVMPKRYLQIYHPNGTTQRLGVATPPPELISRLSEFRSKMSVVYNMDNNQIRWGMHPYSNHHHMNCRIVLYSGDIFAGTGGETITIDQVIANQIGNETPHRSIAINLFPKFESHEGVPPSHFTSLGWRGPSQPVVPYAEPRRLFNTLFPDGGAPPTGGPSLARRRRGLVLDALVEEIGTARRRVSADDRLRLDEYLTGIEELDRRTALLEEEPRLPACDASEPVGMDATERNYPEYLAVMQELSIRAFQCDATRVINFCHASVAGGGRGFNHSFLNGFEGSSDSWHALSHWATPYGNLSQDSELNLRDFTRINQWHYDRVADFLRRLEETPSAEGGNLLDDTLVAWGSSMSQGTDHSSQNLYQVLIGGGDRFRHGSDIDVSGGHTANMHTTMMRAFGAGGSFGQANGDIDSELLA